MEHPQSKVNKARSVIYGIMEEIAAIKVAIHLHTKRIQLYQEEAQRLLSEVEEALETKPAGEDNSIS